MRRIANFAKRLPGFDANDRVVFADPDGQFSTIEASLGDCVIEESGAGKRFNLKPEIRATLP